MLFLLFLKGCEPINLSEPIWTNRMTTRAKANNFYMPRTCTYTFTYSAIDEWNSLPNNVKAMKNEKMFKESLKKTILKDARKSDESPFVYY